MRRAIQNYFRWRNVSRDTIAFEGRHRVTQPAHVQIEADRMSVPRLGYPQEIPRAPQLEIPHRQQIPRSQFRMMLQQLHAPLGFRIHVLGRDEIAIRAPMPSPYPTPQLVQLSQTELVGLVDDHCVGVRDIQPRLYDHRGDQDLHLSRTERPHQIVQVAFLDLPVPHLHSGPRCQPAYALRYGLYCLNAVVHEEHLPASVQLAGNGLHQQFIIPRLHEGQHRRPIAWRSLNQSQVAQPRQRKMQRAWNGCSGERQDVNFEAQRFQPLLVSHTETMFFIHHQQAEVVKLHVLRQQTVCADDDIGGAVLQPRQHLALLGRRSKAR